MRDLNNDDDDDDDDDDDVYLFNVWKCLISFSAQYLSSRLLSNNLKINI
jgi:hypothetical protein